MGATAATPAPPLLERDGDLEVMAAARRDASTGHGRFVVVEGRAGMGKSALLAATRMAAVEEGFDVLTAQASELERQYAFGVVRQLFEGRVRRAPGWLDDAAASARPAFDPAGAGGPAGFDGGPLTVLKACTGSP